MAKKNTIHEVMMFRVWLRLGEWVLRRITWFDVGWARDKSSPKCWFVFMPFKSLLNRLLPYWCLKHTYYANSHKIVYKICIINSWVLKKYSYCLCNNCICIHVGTNIILFVYVSQSDPIGCGLGNILCEASRMLCEYVSILDRMLQC